MNMPDNSFPRPPRRRGFTLLELAVGIAVIAVVGLVSAGLFRAGLGTYNYVSRETGVLTSARNAMSGSGSTLGVIWAGQGASAVQSLSGSSLALLIPGASTMTFLVSGGNMYQSQSGSQTLLAAAVGSAVFSYYNLDGAGHIIVSTSAASANFVTMQLTLTGRSAKDKTYNFLAGMHLHNHL